MPHKRFRYAGIAELEREIQALGLDIPMGGEDLSILFEPVRIESRIAPNRFVVQPMEGFDADDGGAPGELAFRRYERYARGGSAIIWFEATAVLREARSNPSQLWINSGNVDRFAALVTHTRRAAREALAQDLILILQLTHSGRYSKPSGVPRPLIAHHSAVLDPLGRIPADYPVLTDEYLDRLQDTFVNAAKLAAQAGFDGVDIKACHRYLVSELLASHTREGRYGGPLENRARMLIETATRIHSEVPGPFVTTRMNAYDGIPYPYGFGVDHSAVPQPELAEPLEVIRELRALDIPILNVSVGNPYSNPHLGRPYDFPVAGAGVPAEHPLEGVARFLRVTRAVQLANPDLPIVGGGYGWLRHFMPRVAAEVLGTGGATLVGQGRGAFAYPESPRVLRETGRMDPNRVCVTCSGCTQIMRDGGRTGCVVRDSKVYGPEYRLARRFAMDRLKEEARRCRDCDHAACSLGCPAGVDVPGFIKAFLEDRIADAYGLLRARNVLPETCAYVCPSQVQCEGKCLESIFCENPVAIRDIQRVVSQIARRQGLAGVRLPTEHSGRNVVVVGGGPTGIASAVTLLEAGHRVELYEARDRLGGTPEAAIPEARLAATDASAEIQAILDPAIDAGRLTVHYGRRLGHDLRLRDLAERSDAVLLAIGLGASAGLDGARPPEVLDATGFLASVKRGEVAALRGKVAVLGAGNTAMDAASAALGLGAEDVSVVYRRSFAEMPAWKPELDEFLAKGGNVLTLTQPIGYRTDAAGRLTGIEVARTALGAPDASGRRAPRVIAGTHGVLPVSLVIEALGQTLDERVQAELSASGVDMDGRGLVAVRDFVTSARGVYAAGDVTNGGTTAVQGIAEGCAPRLRSAAAWRQEGAPRERSSTRHRIASRHRFRHRAPPRG
jgi:NADPH-dependent glutamate synthase beta subunit-like oxidoreductase/2,4-dienoyl-CoA reductase-like NADH-dependent reductase (Old Yellow Enzyme family)